MDIGTWNQPLVFLSHPMATSAHTQSELRLWEVTMWMIKWCQHAGRGSKQSISSAGCDIYVETEREGFDGTPFSPTLCMRYLIAPDNGQDQTERPPDPKGPWRHKSTYSPFPTLCPPLLPNHRALGSVSLALCSNFPNCFSHPQLLSSAATRNSHVQSGSAIIKKILLRTLTCTSVTDDGGMVLSSVPES